MHPKKVTIHDISRELGIDSSTVSRALNDSDRVTKKTKAVILDKAKEMGYQRNILASNLRTNKTQTIAIVLPRISRYFFATVIAGIEETAQAKGFNVVICQSLDSFEREKKIIHNLISNRVDGILISIAMETTNYEHLQSFQSLGSSIVFFDRPCLLDNCVNITIDNYNASFKATEHLILKGCKHIAHFSGKQTIELYKQRKEGYLGALKKYQMPIDENLIFESNLSEEDGVIMAKKMLENPEIDGLYSSNDTAAISAIQYLKTQGKKIPQDIAVVGFNNDPIAAIIEPSLTTIHQPALEMGKLAANQLILQIEKKSATINSQILTSALIVRDSSSK